jgi:hypothetical protein
MKTLALWVIFSCVKACPCYMSIPGLSAAAVQGPINILLAFGREKVISD